MKIKGNWNFIGIFISGASTLIFWNYLVIGLWEVVINISELLTWLEHNDLNQLINQLLK